MQVEGGRHLVDCCAHLRDQVAQVLLRIDARTVCAAFRRRRLGKRSSSGGVQRPERTDFAGRPAPDRQADRTSAEVKKQASLVAAIVFWLMALAQLLRLLFRVEVRAGGAEIPLWVSVPAVLILGALGAWLWLERRG